MNRLIALFWLCNAWWTVVANAETPLPTIEAMQATRPGLSTPSSDTANVSEALNHVRRTYDVPILSEWSFVDEKRRNIESVERLPFEIKIGDSLSDSLNAACSVAGKPLEWKRMVGSIVVMPADGVSGVESTLDTRISLELKSVSTWEALCAVALAVNESGATDRTLSITPLFLNDRRSGPPAFSAVRDISLSFVDVTARNALLAIIAASSVYMSYQYYNFGGPENEGSSLGSHVMVDPSLPGDSSRDYPLIDSRELYDVWIKQIDAQNPNEASVESTSQSE